MTPASLLPRRARLGAVAAAGLAAAALTTGAASASAATTLFVDPANGHDFSTSGTQDAPLRTIRTALDRAHAGDTVRLAGGQYTRDTNGETFANAFGEARLRVPAGVTLAGEPDAARGRSILVSNDGHGVGLQMDGDGTVKDLLVSNFDAGLRADRGKPRLVGVDFSRDGIELADGADLTYVTSVADPLPGERGGIFTNLEEPAVRLVRGGQIHFLGGVVKGTAGACNLNQRGIVAPGSSGLIIRNARFLNVAGGAVRAGFGSQIDLATTTIDDQNPSGCSPAPAIEDKGFVNAHNLIVRNSGAPGGVAWLHDSPQPSFLADSIVDSWFTGVRTTADTPALSLSHVTITRSSTGIDASASPKAQVTVTGGQVTDGLTGIRAVKLKLRGVTVARNLGTGVLLGSPAADLGTATEPGANTFRGANANGTVRFDTSVGPAELTAVGNTWNPNVQGADAFGRYPAFGFVDGKSPQATGTNFHVAIGQAIRLG